MPDRRFCLAGHDPLDRLDPPMRWRTDGKEVIPEMTHVHLSLLSLLDHEEGQGLAEYALILALIAVVAILALLFLGTQISTILSSIGNVM